MTTAADDSAVEEAFEAYLAGRPVPEETAGTFHGVAAFAEAVRATATQPGRPNAALAELLATGLLTDQSSPSARTAISAGSPPPRRATRVRNRRRFAMIFPVLLAKILSAGAVAQAATGAGLVLVVATGAGATGVLGEDVQDTVTSVVGITSEEATEDEIVAGEDETTETEIEPTPVVETTAPAEPTDAAAFDAAVWAEEGPRVGQSFGEWVSEGVHNKDALAAAAALQGADRFRFGQVVSEWARNKGMSAEELEGEGVELEELTDIPVEPVTEESGTEADAVTETEPTQTATPQRGNGNGNGGRGNGGNGGGNGNGRN